MTRIGARWGRSLQREEEQEEATQRRGRHLLSPPFHQQRMAGTTEVGRASRRNLLPCSSRSSQQTARRSLPVPTTGAPGKKTRPQTSFREQCGPTARRKRRPSPNWLQRELPKRWKKRPGKLVTTGTPGAQAKCNHQPQRGIRKVRRPSGREKRNDFNAKGNFRSGGQHVKQEGP